MSAAPDRSPEGAFHSATAPDVQALRLLIANNADGLLVIDRDDVVVFANAAAPFTGAAPLVEMTAITSWLSKLSGSAGAPFRTGTPASSETDPARPRLSRAAFTSASISAAVG